MSRRARLRRRKAPARARTSRRSARQLNDLPAQEYAQTQRLASLGFMIASVCHEVSNPLAAIHSMVQLLQSPRGAAPETVQKGLASIAFNIGRVLAITKKLGDFSRVAGDALVPVSIDSVVADATALLREVPAAQVDVLYHGRPEAATLARPGELERVVLNVLTNAAQAMGGSGRIEALVDATDEERWRLTVRDHGPGIASEHLERVFEPFFTTKAPGEGTGLGLAISYEIVLELGGEMHARNAEGGGAAFDILLPRHPG